MRTLTGLHPVREQQVIDRLTLSIARASEPRIRREINRAMKQIATASNATRLSSVMLVHQANMRDILINTYTSAANTFGKRIFDATQKAQTLQGTPTFTNAMKLWIQKTVADRVTQIANTTRDQAIRIIRDTTEAAVSEGLGEVAMGERIIKAMAKEAASISTLRANIIARTETHAAANATNMTAAKDTGLPLMKEWVSGGDDRTRDSHRDANGQKVGVDDYFKVGDSLLMYPGDPNGDGEDVINCRCSAVYLVV
jgi:uncharacterized protein with gpF-like domain